MIKLQLKMMAAHLEEILFKYWKHKAFRPLQKEIISTVLAGEDVLAILPTGGGKSICYQVPSLVLDGITLVISPLIALMQDQVEHLKKKGIAAACIHSGMPKGMQNDVLQQALNGHLKLLYLAPERLQGENFQNALSEMDVSLVAIDEAHCISQWGHDFRPAYLDIAQISRQLKKKVPWIALTATATPKVQEEIVQYLGMKKAKLFRQSVFRSNLSYMVMETENKLSDIIQLFQGRSGSAILYCNTRRRCMEMRHWLEINGVKALAYHAGLPKEERALVQKQWMQSSDKVMCATSAFGMGIDKEDVRQVVHLSPPESLEAYYQESGRAGRNGLPAQCVMFFNQMDRERLAELPAIQYPPKKFVLKVYGFICDFLQIPINSGKDTLFSFDVVRFARNFKLNLLQVMSAVKIIEKSGIWLWEQQAQFPATVQVLATEEELQTFKTLQPELYQVIIALLRLHSGIFSFPVRLNSWDMTKYLNIDWSLLQKSLRKLDCNGFIRFQDASEGGFLYFRQERSLPQGLSLEVRRIKSLKKALQIRIAEMVTYLENDAVCRSVLLAHYFGEQHAQKCNHCDNCKSSNQYAGDEIALCSRIQEKLKEYPNTELQMLSSHFPGLSEEMLIKYLRRLQDEGFCRVLPNGMIFYND